MKYPPIPVISYNDFGQRIYNRTLKERIPIDGVMELTRRCNLKCTHCYAVHDPSKKELTYKQICHILDEITKAGCLWMTFTGGEVLLRDDFLDIYTHAKKQGMIIVILTNGTLITPRIADYFRKYPPYLLEITLNGVTKDTYEAVTGVSGSFKRCLEGIHLLIRRNIPLNLKTTVTTLNMNELWQIKNYVERLGINFRFDALLHPAVNGSKRPCKFRISPEKVVEFDLTDEKRNNSWKEFYQKCTPPSRSDTIYACGAGINSFHINPYGELSLCDLSPDHYNLCEGSFIEGWRNFICEIRRQKRKKESECTRCSLFSICNPCPDWAKLETGDREKPVHYLCQIARLRTEAFRNGGGKKWAEKKLIANLV